jgi:eukaryotic-like serine/threonine-protein kinase
MPCDPFAGTRFQALSRLASGTMGDLYVVEHIELGKRFAAKLLRPEFGEDPHVVDRIRLEAESLGRVRHPNVVGITGFDRTLAGTPFIVMELLKGHTLAEEVASRGPLPLQEALDWTLQLLSALEAVHTFGIVHRDIKPQDLLLHQLQSGERQLKLLDFGAARVLAGVSDQAPNPLAVPTRTGFIVGTPEFASPEAALGKPTDIRTDIYQVGLNLYFMLTGGGPFDHANSSHKHHESIRRAHAKATPVPPSRRMPRPFPEGFDEVILRALAKNPAERFQDAAEFGVALRHLRTSIAEHGSGSLSASRPTIPARHRVRREFGAFARALLFVIFTVLFAAVVVAVGRVVGSIL